MLMKSGGVAEAKQTLNKDLLSEEERLFLKGLDGDGEKDPGGESFEELFAKFADMKGKVK